MNILITNDDGIHAEGIQRLAGALEGLADIYVCAPDEQRSACGHGITIHESIEVEMVEFSGAKLAYAIGGTPADCVKIGLKLLESQGVEIDMVFSGINHGSNLGTDTLYSGTVSAAVEGSLCGKPSVAVSVDARAPEHFEKACSLAAMALKNGFGKIDEKTVLNINTPDLPEDEIKGTRITTLGVREYSEWFKEDIASDGTKRYSYEGRPLFRDNIPDGVDIAENQKGYATITPLHYDLTDYGLIDTVKSWKLDS